MLALHLSSKIWAILLLAVVLIIASCDNAGEPIVPAPADVHMVHHSFADDTLALERGIDAVPENDGIFLAWYDLNDSNIGQYNIYRRRNDESYFRIIKRIILEQVSSGRDTTFIDDNSDQGLDVNIYYHYFVTATNTQDEESGAEDTLKYKLLSKPETRQPDGQTYESGLDTLLIFTWDFVEVPNFYILKIENSFGHLHYIGVFQVTEFFESQTLELKSIHDFPQLIPGTYKWRIDSVGPDEDNSGSESKWKTFLIR